MWKVTAIIGGAGEERPHYSSGGRGWWFAEALAAKLIRFQDDLFVTGHGRERGSGDSCFLFWPSRLIWVGERYCPNLRIGRVQWGVHRTTCSQCWEGWPASIVGSWQFSVKVSG